jgi:serine/threonine protein kinase
MTGTYSTSELEAALENRFIIDRQIGQGGQATVFLARRKLAIAGEPIDQAIALKLYKADSEDERVKREIEALRGFEHPCLSRFLEQGSATVARERIKYVAWAYIPGKDLRHLIADRKIPLRTVAVIGRDVSRALDHLWSKRIVHRDVNPRNIIVRDDGAGAVLIDLGIARHLDRTTITPAGLTWGTMGYLSPEQWKGDNLSCLSDVFSLGTSLQEALSGEHPTNGNQALLVTAPPKTGALSPIAPVALAEVIDKCLELRAAFRPSPTELAAIFANIADLLT